MWWLAMICGHGRRGVTGGAACPRLAAGAEAGGRGLGWGRRPRPLCPALTWRVVGIMRFRPSTEMLTAMLMPAKRRLLLPRMEKRALLGACGGEEGGGNAAPQDQASRGGGGRGGARETPGSALRSEPTAQHPARSPGPGGAEKDGPGRRLTFFFQMPFTPGTASYSLLMASLQAPSPAALPLQTPAPSQLPPLPTALGTTSPRLLQHPPASPGVMGLSVRPPSWGHLPSPLSAHRSAAEPFAASLPLAQREACRAPQPRPSPPVSTGPGRGQQRGPTW